MQTTAAQLWQTWTDAGLLQPQSYDADIADAVGRHFQPPSPSDLVAALTGAGWTPRDLLRAILPELASFSGMLQDLLRLYERVGARTATGQNLRISYEFTDGDPIDTQLAAFRKDVALTINLHHRAVNFGPDFAFGNPARQLDFVRRPEQIFETEELGEWPFDRGAPRPTPTGNERADAIIERGLSVVDAILIVLAGIGANTRESTEWLRNAEGARGTVEHHIAQAATDYWPMLTTATFHELADAVRAGTAGRRLLDEVSAWLDEFTSDSTNDAVADDLASLLSMPSWGKRHELYSAWMASQFDKALATDRAEFRVIDGSLRFPFKATHLADLVVEGGAYELWCEMRSDLVDSVSGKRSRGIQPDYRVVRRHPGGGSTTVLALEVKQYQHSAAVRHAKVLAMYTAGLPDATVLLVAHGPLGKHVQDRVPAAARKRTAVFENVRPGRWSETATFRAELSRLLPPPVRLVPVVVELRWNPGVQDMDLHVGVATGEAIHWKNVASTEGTLRADAFDGGPEVVDLSPENGLPLDVSVHLYSHDSASVSEADPEVTIGWSDGSLQLLRPMGPTADPRWWRVCRFDQDGLALFTETEAI